LLLVLFPPLGVPKPLPPPLLLSVREGGAIPSCLRTAIDMRGPSTTAAPEEGALLLLLPLRAAAAAAETEAAVGVETAEEGCVVAAEAFPPPPGPKREGTDCWCKSIEEALLLFEALLLLVFSPKSGGAKGENPAPLPPPPEDEAPATPPPPIEVDDSGVPGPLWGMLSIPPSAPLPPREEEE